MGTQRSVYEIYGMLMPDDTDREALEEAIGQCSSADERAGVFAAGAYDRNMIFLAVTWREVELDEYSFHPTLVGGFDEERYALELDYNAELAHVVKQQELRPVEGPGWYVIPDESR